MKRREFIKAIAGTAAAAWPFAAHAQQTGRTPHLDAFRKARRDYEKVSHPSEAARSDYITRLVRMREKVARQKTDEWQAIDSEIKRHPAPQDSDSKALSGRLVGKWASPRHDYLFRADGTWAMLPAETDGIKSTHGTWRIEGNQFFDTAAMDPPEPSQYTIILITEKDFVFADQTHVFYETRIKSKPGKANSKSAED